MLDELGAAVAPLIKDLEVYATDKPPTDYSLDIEVEGIRRVAGEAGFERFHLVGYQGGAAASLTFTAAYPGRVLGLALLEPAWAGNEGLSITGQEVRRRFRSLSGGPRAW